MIKYPTNLKNVKSSASRERASKAAIAIGEYLKIHPIGASQKKLEEVVLSQYPEWKELSQQAAGKLSTQTKLTNDIAWGKNALKDGGYTQSKENSARGGKEVLKLTEKGKLTHFEKKEELTYEQHYVLIKEGKI
jgi:hypothetical protein